MDGQNALDSLMTTDDHHLLDELSHIADTLGPFSFGTLTNTLSTTEQLAFSYKLIATAGRIRARVEKATVDQGIRTIEGDAL